MPTERCDHPVVNAIDSYWERNQDREGRRHLGASLIGRKCSRELWYKFRWATPPNFSGRMLRLFDRGHKEEFRFVEFLEQIGVEVTQFAEETYTLLFHEGSFSYVLMERQQWLQGPAPNEPLDDVTGDPLHERLAARQGIEIPQRGQLKISDCNGHFGGSLDGEGKYIPGVAQYLGLPHDAKGLLEFKTHGEKSFQKLQAERVRIAKPEHYSQMQIYMRKRNLPFALYVAVCKNDDQLYCEFILPDHQHADTLLAKANAIIYSKRPPDRISKSPTWIDCKYCDEKGPCHFGKPMQRNCRTCVHVNPTNDGRWHCGLWNGLIPKQNEKDGCDRWTQITD